MFTKKNKGFSLIELLLLIGVIAIMIIGVFSYYNKKFVEEKSKLQINALMSMQNGIDGTFLGTTNFTTLTPANVVAWGLAQPEDIQGATVNNKFGGTITFNTTTIAGVNGYEIVLSRVPAQACAFIANSTYVRDIPGITINATPGKTDNTVPTQANKVTMINSCATGGDNNTIRIRNTPFLGTSGVAITPPVATRGKEDAYFIPAIGNTVTSTSPATVCNTGVTGATWNGNFCSCPVNTRWNGSTCQALGTNGWCQFGTGSVSSGAPCTALPATPATSTRYVIVSAPTLALCNVAANGFRSTGGAYWDGTQCLGIKPSATKVAGSSSSPAPTYNSGRNLPSTPTIPSRPSMTGINVNSAQAACTNAAGHWDGRICNYCPNPTTMRNASGAIVPLTPPGNAAKTSVWNAARLRCVTP